MYAIVTDVKILCVTNWSNSVGNYVGHFMTNSPNAFSIQKTDWLHI